MNQRIASMAENQHGERVIRIDFPYDLDMINKVRSLPGRQYHPEERCWSAPIHEQSLHDLINWGFLLDTDLSGFLEKIQRRKLEVISGNEIKMKGDLYPFQKEGVAWIESRNGRALIADEMGLGKSAQALGWISMHPEHCPVIIVCPASIKLNWAREITKWTEETKITILSGSIGLVPKGSRIIIINYDILHAWIDKLKMINPRVLILDEIHAIKSSSARRTKVTKKLAKNIPYIIGLSGTPIVNRPIEAYNALKILSPDLFPDYWHFARQYCNMKYNGFGWDMSGHSNELEFHQKLVTSVMIRRLKKDVLKELPDKIQSFVPIELRNASEYSKAENDFINFVRETKGKDAARRASNAESFAKIEVLKQLAVKGKLRSVIEWIEDFLEVEGKLVVFATHRFVIDELMKAFPNIAVKLDGSMNQNQRQESIDQFQNSPDIKLFIGNIKASGVGITLTAASNVAFIELGWSPSEIDQASDRCHRIGQKDTVTIYYLLATGTIEERIAKLMDKKRKTISAVLDGTAVTDEVLLYELMKEYE